MLSEEALKLSFQAEHCGKHPETWTCATEARRDGRQRPSTTDRAPRGFHKQTVVCRTKDGGGETEDRCDGTVGGACFQPTASQETGVLASSRYDFSHERRQVMAREV